MPEQYEISPLKLWSPLERQLAACAQKRATPEQWIGTIRNLQKRGVSAAELEWSEILIYLQAHPKPQVTIEELLSVLADNPPCELRLQRHIVDEFSPVVRYVKRERPAELPEPTTQHGRREVRLLQYQDRSFGLSIWLHVEVDTGLFGRHKYWTFSVPRGRKHPLANTEDKKFSTANEAMAYGRELVQRMARRLAARGFVGPTKGIHKFTRYALTGGDHYTEWLLSAPNLYVDYRGPHFGIHNLVAHVRTTERITSQGLRLLLLEEIQSDWNQQLSEAKRAAKTSQQPINANTEALRDEDFDEPIPPANPYEHHWLEAALRMMLLLAADRGFAGVGWLPGKLHIERFPWAKAEGLTAFYDRIVPAEVAKLGKSWAVGLDAAEFTTYSRHYRVGKIEANGKWRVFKSDWASIFDDEFSEFPKAEAFRLTKETPVQETVPVLYISDQMRADIKTNGLPYLGSVGRRNTTASATKT